MGLEDTSENSFLSSKEAIEPPLSQDSQVVDEPEEELTVRGELKKSFQDLKEVLEFLNPFTSPAPVISLNLIILILIVIIGGLTEPKAEVMPDKPYYLEVDYSSIIIIYSLPLVEDSVGNETVNLSIAYSYELEDSTLITGYCNTSLVVYDLEGIREGGACSASFPGDSYDGNMIITTCMEYSDNGTKIDISPLNDTTEYCDITDVSTDLELDPTQRMANYCTYDQQKLHWTFEPDTSINSVGLKDGDNLPNNGFVGVHYSSSVDYLCNYIETGGVTE